MFTTVTKKMRQLVGKIDISFVKHKYKEVTEGHLPGIHIWFKEKVKGSSQDAQELLATITKKVKDLTDNVDISQVKDTYGQYKDKCEDLLEAYFPIVQAWLKEKLGTLSREVVQNDVLMSQALFMVYGLLPYPVRLIIREDLFIAFFLERRSRFLDKYVALSPAFPLQHVQHAELEEE